MAEDGIGSVSVEVVPDATDFWRRFEAATGPGATQAGRSTGRKVRAGMEEELGKPVDVKVNAKADTAKARAEIDALKASQKDATFQAHLLADAIIGLGPAAVPIAGVLAGAFIGAIPAVATLALGIKGIQDDMKAGSLTGTKYATDFAALRAEATQLKQVAAGGLLTGIDQGLQGAHPLFAAVNSEIGVMSAQLGGIIGHAGPALLNIFTQLNPLFETFGAQLVNGATHLEHWAASSDGVSKFVAYVQTELPKVEHDLGQVVEAAVKMVAGFAPLGSVVLHSLGLVAQAINALDPGHLSEIETVLIAGYAAWRVYGAASAGAANIAAAGATKAAAAALATKAADSQAAAAAAASANVQAQAAREVALAKAVEANAAAEAAVEEAAAYEETGAADTALTRIIAENAIERATALQGSADAAVAAAAETAAAAQAAADGVITAGVEAEAGWTAALGPLAAVAVGVTLLTSVFGGNDKAAQANQQSINNYTESLKQNADALASVNIAATNKQLQDKNAFKNVDTIAASNKSLGLTYGQVALAVNGSDAQYKSLITTLAGVAEANKTVVKTATAGRGGSGGGTSSVVVYNAQGKAANDLSSAITNLRGNLTAAEKAQEQYNEALKEAQIQTDGGSTAVASQARALGLTADAYLAAQQAAQKNTEQTQQQTAAWQYANDAGNLLQQTLDKLSGKKISYAQADNQFQSQLVALAKNFQGGSKAISGLSEAAIANRGNLLQLVTGAQQTAEAYGEMAGSSAKGRQKLIELRQQIIDNAVAHGADKKAVTDYINSLLAIPTTVPPTKLDVDNAAAAAKIKTIQDAINALHGKQLDIKLNLTGQGAKNAAARADVQGGFAAGGSVRDGWFTVGEQGYEVGYKRGSQVQIFSNNASKQMTGVDSVPGYASGTGGGDVVTLTPSKSSTSSSTAKSAAAVLFSATKLGQAATALDNAAKSTSSTYSQLKTAADALDSAAITQKISGSAMKVVLAEQSKLLTDAARRDALRSQLGTAPTAPTAYDKLTTALQNYTQEKSSVATAFGGLLNLSSLGQSGYTDQPGVSATSILAGLTGTANQAGTLSSQLATLKAKGLNSGLLAQLAANPGSDAQQIAALAGASTSTIAAVNKQFGRLNYYSGQAGTTAASSLYGAGLSAAQGLVNGLKAQEGALSAEVSTYAKLIENGIKSHLGIHSPSTVGHQIGDFFGQGVVKGLISQHEKVQSAAAGIADAVVAGGRLTDPAFTGSRRSGDAGSHYHAHGIQDPVTFLALARQNEYMRAAI